MTSAPWSTRCTTPGIGVIVDWVPAHFPNDEFAPARVRRHAALRARRSAPRRRIPDWGTLIFDFGRPEVRNFLVANALFWLDRYHIDGLRVDAVASMLYLDYSRKAGEWMPNQYGGRENLEAIAFLREVNERVVRALPRRRHHRRGVDGLGRRHAPDLPGRARLRLQVGHGLDARHARATSPQDPIHRRFHHNRLTFRMLYVFTENFVLPLSHDEVVHGKGSLLGKMPGDDWQQLRQPARCCSATMFTQPARSCCSWAASSRQWPSGTTTPPSVGSCWTIPMQAAFGRSSRTSDGSTGLPRALGRRPGPGALLDRRLRRRVVGVLVDPARGGEAGGGVAEPDPGPAAGLPPRAAFGRRWVEVLNSDSEHYGGSNVGNLGGLDASDQSWHGQPASVSLVLPPLATVVLVPEG